MNGFFATDGPLFTFMYKAGQIVIINIICLVCCIPIVKIIPALSAMYYATVKAVRHDRGYAVKEYFRSFVHCLGKGILFGILYLTLFLLIYIDIFVVKTDKSVYLTIYGIILSIFSIALMYLIPILSRFKLKFFEMIKLSLIMSVRHLPTTLVLIAGLGALIFAQIYIFPMVTIVFVPCGWCFVASYLTERVMKKYMSVEVSEDADAWYLE